MEKQRFKVRRSRIQGKGVFATQRIRKSTRIVEYTGERVSPEEGDRRYSNGNDDGPILLFKVDKRLAIDAGVGGNDARFINHSCDPNCESVIDKRHVYIEAIRTIQPGEELTYDYSLTRDEDDPPDIDKEYVCHCGSSNCRGSMLEPLPKRRKNPANVK